MLCGPRYPQITIISKQGLQRTRSRRKNRQPELFHHPIQPSFLARLAFRRLPVAPFWMECQKFSPVRIFARHGIYYIPRRLTNDPTARGTPPTLSAESPPSSKKEKKKERGPQRPYAALPRRPIRIRPFLVVVVGGGGVRHLLLQVGERVRASRVRHRRNNRFDVGRGGGVGSS